MKYLKEYAHDYDKYINSNSDIYNTISDILHDYDLEFKIMEHAPAFKSPDVCEIIFTRDSDENIKFIDELGFIFSFEYQFTKDQKSRISRFRYEANKNPIISRICKLTGLTFDTFNCDYTPNHRLIPGKQWKKEVAILRIYFNYPKPIKEHIENKGEIISDILIDADLEFTIGISPSFGYEIHFDSVTSEENKRFVKIFSNLDMDHRKSILSLAKSSPTGVHRSLTPYFINGAADRLKSAQKNPTISRICQLSNLKFKGFHIWSGYHGGDKSLTIYFSKSK